MHRFAMAVCVCAVAVSAAAVAWVQPAASARGPAGALGWTKVYDGDAGGWTGRAGLQAAQLGSELFVMGGRGAFSPFATQLYDDVWRSGDMGASWERVATGAWPARGYFQTVTKDGAMFVLGGQNFDTVPNPAFPGCIGIPGPPCLPFVPQSTFFADVWSSRDGAAWTRLTSDAGWAGRAGLTAVEHRGEIFVFGGSTGDDAATGGSGRVFFNDVWKSRDGVRWTRVTEHAGWSPRAGAAAVTKNGFIYLLGGEIGFTCGGVPGCVPPYFNDVWRSRDGATWERVSAAAGWSPRPGHQCATAFDTIVCFGGYGEPENPNDMWASVDGSEWTKLPVAPWNAATADDVRYDFDALFVNGGRVGVRPAIMTFGGDRERFELPPDVNAGRVENDVWRFSWGS